MHKLTTASIHFAMYEHERLQYNAVFFFFALALADHAFKGISTIEELMRVRLPDGRDSWELEWDERVLDLPILWMATYARVESRALTYSSPLSRAECNEAKQQLVCITKRS